jgi:hypothetical protein
MSGQKRTFGISITVTTRVSKLVKIPARGPPPTRRRGSRSGRGGHISTVSSVEGGRFEPSFPRKEKALLRDRPFELSGTGAPGEISSLRFGAFFTVTGSVSRRSRVFRSSRGNSVVEPIRSPNYGKLQALGLFRRENTTLFRGAVDASTIRTARRATAPSGRGGG